MATKTLHFAQFKHKWADHISDYSPKPARFYYLIDEYANYEFTETIEDEDGDEVEDDITVKCIRITTHYDDIRNDTNYDDTYISKDAEYTVFSLDVEVDDDDRIQGLAKTGT